MKYRRFSLLRIPSLAGPVGFPWRAFFTALLVVTFSLMPLPVTPREASILVKLAPARAAVVQKTLTAYGTVEYSPNKAQVLDVLSEALVDQVLVAAGEKVRQRQLLLRMKASPNAETEVENARIAVKFARQALSRMQDMRARQLATNADVQAAQQALATAEATLANARRRFRTVGELRAPMDGVIQTISVSQGDIVPAGTPLLRLAKEDRLRVRLGVEPEDLPRVKIGQQAFIAPLYQGARVLPGKVQHIYYQVDPNTRLAEVVVPLPAAPELLPGAVVRGRIVVEERQALTVPRQAILRQDGKPYVFVAEKGRARIRWVETGLDDGRRAEIGSGVQAGEHVVVLGNYELKDGMALRVVEKQ